MSSRTPFAVAPLILALLCAGTRPVRAETGFSVLGNGFTGRPVVLKGDLVLETNGLMEGIRDFTDPEAPAWVGWNDHSNSIYWSRVYVDEGLVVGVNADQAQGPVGFSVNDLSLPGSPSELGVFTGFAGRSGWMNDGALLLCDEDVAVAFDLSMPASPVFSAAVLLGRFAGDRWPTTVGSTLYLIDDERTVRALDVTLPRHPADLGTLPPATGRIDALAGGDGVLYLLVAEDCGAGSTCLDLVTWDLGTPGSPVETSRRTLVKSAGAAGRTLAASGDILLASATGSGLRAFGLADPTDPVPGWSLDLEPDRVVITPHAILVGTPDALSVFGRVGYDRDPAPPVRRTVLPAFATVVGDGPIQVAQLYDDPSVLVPVDVSEPTQPRLGKPVDTGLTGQLHFAGGVGMMRGSEVEVQLLDLAEPREPRPLGRITLPYPSAFAGLYPGDVLLVGYWSKYNLLDLYDVRDPERPTWAARLPEQSPRYCDRRWLVCGLEDPVRVYALDDGLQPTLFGELATELTLVRSALVVEGHVYLFGEGSGRFDLLEIHRLGDPPARLGQVQVGVAPARVDRYRNHLFVQGGRECAVLDVADPAHPVPMGSFPAPRRTSNGFAMNGDVATVSDRLITVKCEGYAVVDVPRVSVPRGVRLDPARPNPFNPVTNISFATDADRVLSVTVYDGRGRLVAELAGGRFTAGTHVVTWDGRSGGEPAASGVYFVRVHGAGVEAVQAVTLLK